MLNCLCCFFLCVFFCIVKCSENTKLTLHHMWNIFIIQLTKIEFKIWRVTFFKSFLPLIYLGGGGVWTSGFHAIDDWPRAHWDETEFNVMLLYYDFYLIKIPVYILSTDLTRNGLSLRPSLKSRTNIDYFLFISYGIESTCIRLS